MVDENLVGEQCIAGDPDLVVEVHSPSTKVLDLTEKRLVYAQARIPAYWLVDAEGSLEVSVPFTMTIEGRAIFE